MWISVDEGVHRELRFLREHVNEHPRGDIRIPLSRDDDALVVRGAVLADEFLKDRVLLDDEDELGAGAHARYGGHDVRHRVARLLLIVHHLGFSEVEAEVAGDQALARRVETYGDIVLENVIDSNGCERLNLNIFKLQRPHKHCTKKLVKTLFYL